MTDEFLVYDSGVDPFGIQKGPFNARKDPAVSSPDDVTDSLVEVFKHPTEDKYASPITDTPLPLRNPNQPTVAGVDLSDKIPERAPGGPDELWHNRINLKQWGTIKTRSEMDDAGWFPDQ